MPNICLRITAYKGGRLWNNMSNNNGITRVVTEDCRVRIRSAMSNFPPKQIGKFMSEVLVLGFPDEAGEVVLIAPDHKVPDGERMY